ncbi:MAG: T9SS type A sorting domain-containing protein [Microbacter sp.]
MRISPFIATVTFLFGISWSVQSQIGTGQWQTHFSYRNVMQVAVSPRQVFAVGSNALFSVSLTDQSIDFYSKITGLSDNNITQIAFNNKTNELLVVYANSNLDFVSSSGVYNVPDLYLKQATMDKTVNSILFADSLAYLSCNFGIVVVNTQKHEISDSYVIGAGGSYIPVLATALFNGKIYGLTANGLSQADASSHNLANFQVWTNVATLPDGSNLNLLSFDGALWLLKANGTVYKSTDGIVWSAVLTLSKIARMQSDNKYLYFISDANATTYVYDNNLNVTTLTGFSPNQISVDNSTKHSFWLASGNAGLQQVNQSGQTVNAFTPSGPFDNSPWALTFGGDKLFEVPGGAWEVQYFHPASVSMLQNNEWTNIDGATISQQTNMPATTDFVSITADPKDNTHFFVGAYGMGLYEFKNNAFAKWYNCLNSGVESIFPGQSNQLQYQRIDGLKFDQQGNLWFLNTQINDPVKYLSPDGLVHSLYFDAIKGFSNLLDILIDNANPNRKWIISSRINPGVFVFDDNGTLDNQQDDQSKFFSSFVDQDGNFFVSDFYFCITQDLNNQIWIGTSKGPIVIQNPNNVYSSNFTIWRIKVPRNDGTNLADYLLGNERINAIAVDGANRKWIGTQTSGLYLVSPDGTQILQHFTTDNSPLLSNAILSLALNNQTGELFIGTNQGLVSYMTDATQATATFSNVHAYPNPVRPDFHGVITITGLMADSQVKITNISGDVIYQTTSNGGVATWDGNNTDGSRVSSGVYLIMCTSSDGTQHVTEKLLIIK